MDLAQLLGWIATILFSIMLIPQIIKTIKLRNTNGVSLLLFITYLIANIIALVYAYLINQPPLIIKYFIGIATAEIYIIVFMWYYKRKIRKNTTSSG
ncbi:MAG TPA: PQ-loop repeat-containing protein [Candidatus Nanoarchaeia archaeon]|nr:PQ-loop repeat-containing protein [Candidatus Nanoarchaeia archaeon]